MKKDKQATPVAEPAQTVEVTFLKNHQLNGVEVLKDEKRTLPTKTAERLRAKGIVN